MSINHKFSTKSTWLHLASGKATVFLMSLILFLSSLAYGFEGFDVVSGILESPQFKGKDLRSRLLLASEMLKENKLSRTETSYLLLDWVDQYLREPPDPLDRLRRWSEFSNDEKFSNLKVPRDFLNRTLLAEFLVKQPNFYSGSPHKKLEILRKLHKKKLIEWSVALSYENLIAGSLINGAKIVDTPSPAESLATLKKLREDNLVGDHYRVMAEGVLATEVLAKDPEYHKASPMERLVKIRDLEKRGLISTQTKKDLERIPAWRLVTNDPTFLRMEPSQKRLRLSKLKNEGILTSSTNADFNLIFKGIASQSTTEPKPVPIPTSGLQQK